MISYAGKSVERQSRACMAGVQDWMVVPIVDIKIMLQNGWRWENQDKQTSASVHSLTTRFAVSSHPAPWICKPKQARPAMPQSPEPQSWWRSNSMALRTSLKVLEFLPTKKCANRLIVLVIHVTCPLPMKCYPVGPYNCHDLVPIIPLLHPSQLFSYCALSLRQCRCHAHTSHSPCCSNTSCNLHITNCLRKLESPTAT